MKNILFSILIVSLFTACNNNKKKSENREKTTDVKALTEITSAENIANRLGYQNWKNVSEIQYTFNVIKGRKTFSRSWEFHPKTNEVKMISITDTVQYNRNNFDSIYIKFDKAFINDKFWLMAPFNMIKDSGITFSEQQEVIAPISGDLLNKLTATYANEGGYTPGDAYDFYYDKNYQIKEWSFRKGNLNRPSLSTTWEDYKTINGLTFSTVHQDTTKLFKVFFTNISVKN
ncbi:MAG: hypothetical protein COB12_06335 [Flavobacterium sp.]|nr:MAG: hypothetical protein COB12_06335 [Flavobacterium sp.]